MAKRFSDTDKWKKPFIRGLQGAYKLFWFYILDDCDHAGIWHVDFEVAEIRIGESLNEKRALEIFADKIQVINGGSKWFIRDFIDFQYGELKPNNRLHVSVLNVLEKNGLGACKPLARGQGQEQGTIQGKGQGHGNDTEKKKIEDFIFNDELFMADLIRSNKGKDLKLGWEQCWIHFSQLPNGLLDWEWKQKFAAWVGRMKIEKSGKDSNGKTKLVQ